MIPQTRSIPSPRARAHRPRRAARNAALCVVIVLSAVFAAPARGADEQGWFVALDAALAQPALDRDWADQIDSSGSPVVSTRHRFENDGDIALRASFGYGFGPDRGFLRVSYWSFDGDDGDGGALAGFVNPLVFGAGYYGGFYYLYDAAGVSSRATSEVEAVTVDLDYARPLKHGRRLRANLIAGVRYAGFEEDLTFHGDDNAFFTVDQEKTIEADAFGVRTGAEIEYDFGRIFALSGGMAVSLLRSDTEAAAAQVIRDPGGALLASESRTASNSDARGVILEASLQGLWRIGRVDLFVGLEASDWEGLVRDPIPAEDGSDRDGISFSSVHAGLRFWFTDRRPGVRSGEP